MTLCGWKIFSTSKSKGKLKSDKKCDTTIPNLANTDENLLEMVESTRIEDTKIVGGITNLADCSNTEGCCSSSTSTTLASNKKKKKKSNKFPTDLLTFSKNNKNRKNPKKIKEDENLTTHLLSVNPLNNPTSTLVGSNNKKSPQLSISSDKVTFLENSQPEEEGEEELDEELLNEEYWRVDEGDLEEKDEFEYSKTCSYSTLYFGNSGNPRNKCALKPGHSLMDWIRLGTSGVDLAGTKGVIAPISSAELAKHCKQDDAWIAIRGKVFNVTQYMDFHPGGPDELLKGIGQDATKIFEEVHAWVNYEQLLAKCFIGPLRNIVNVDLEPIKPRQKSTTPTPESSGNVINYNDFKKPNIPIRLSNSEKTSPIKISPDDDGKTLDNIKGAIAESDKIIQQQQKKSPAEIVPRFDWIQKTSDLALIFYTKPFLNPGLLVTCNSSKNLNIRIIVERIIHEFQFEFHADINWPCTVRIARESGKVEVICCKLKPQLWTTFGTMKRDKQSYDSYEDFEFQIENCEPFNHDSYAISVKSSRKDIIITPIGYHISLTAFVNGEYVTRSYTPIPITYLPFQCANSHISMLIKSYADGILAKYITSQHENKSFSFKLSAPKGNFSLSKLLDHSQIALLAAGSGITPMLGVLDHLLGRSNNRIEHIELMFFNKTEDDIWCREKLESIALKDNRLVVRHILSEPESNWNGEKGRIIENLVEHLRDSKQTSYVTFCCVCGPTQFNDLALKLLTGVGFTIEQLHFFQG